jgi:hypothetical protein
MSLLPVKSIKIDVIVTVYQPFPYGFLVIFIWEIGNQVRGIAQGIFFDHQVLKSIRTVGIIKYRNGIGSILRFVQCIFFNLIRQVKVIGFLASSFIDVGILFDIF